MSDAPIDAEADAPLERLDAAPTPRERDPGRWDGIVAAASARRLPWRESARRYLNELYAP